jgi:hypothetical protein
VDRESEARAIAQSARHTRTKLPRSVWIVAIVVAALCVGVFVIGVLVGGTGGGATAPRKPDTGDAGGFWLGLTIGIGAGIAIGSTLALRKRDRE